MERFRVLGYIVGRDSKTRTVPVFKTDKNRSINQRNQLKAVSLQ
jgi:hypothetical protein